jgi:acyl dehydratase
MYDDLRVGDLFDGAPAMQLTDGLAAAHHAIVGGRLRLAFDPVLSAKVTGRHEPFVAPAFVWDVAIGQSTQVTQRAVANLFYRDLVFVHAPVIGDVLRTTTRVTGLRPATAKPGRAPRGLVTMRIKTVNQDGLPVLDFHRCAMLPARMQQETGPIGEADPPRSIIGASQLLAAVRTWDFGAFRALVPGPHFADLADGMVYELADGDVVSSAPELARLTMNLAAIHHDRTASPSNERLVYGGHTIGLATAQLTRALPSLLTILAWDDCNHLGPVHEGDTLKSTITIVSREMLADGGGLVRLRSQVQATSPTGTVSDVLDWRLVALFA